MHFPVIPTIALLLTSVPVLAAPACVAGGYATFYTDYSCTQNGGRAVAMDNAGCLANQYGRHSIYIQGSCAGDIKKPRLVHSPGNNCNCQNYCTDVPNFTQNGCWNIGNPNAQSYRFITQGCGGNNC